jgi:hypothetical protein
MASSRNLIDMFSDEEERFPHRANDMGFTEVTKALPTSKPELELFCKSLKKMTFSVVVVFLVHVRFLRYLHRKAGGWFNCFVVVCSQDPRRLSHFERKLQN